MNTLSKIKIQEYLTTQNAITSCYKYINLLVMLASTLICY